MTSSDACSDKNWPLDRGGGASRLVASWSRSNRRRLESGGLTAGWNRPISRQTESPRLYSYFLSFGVRRIDNRSAGETFFLFIAN